MGIHIGPFRFTGRGVRWRQLIGGGVIVATAALLAGCGSSTPGSTSADAASSATAAPAVSCRAQFHAWQHGPARMAGKALIAKFHAVVAAANAEDFPHLVTALKDAGHAVAAMAADPMPHCADPHGYWPQMLTHIRAGADNAGTGSGLGALMLAMVPLKQVPALERRLSTELKQTVGASKTFS